MIAPAWVVKVVQDLPPRFTGYVQINCVEGGIANVTKLETFRPAKKTLDTIHNVVIVTNLE